MKKVFCLVLMATALFFGYNSEKKEVRETLYPKPIVKVSKIKQKRLLAYVPLKLPVQEVKNYRKVSDILLQFQGSAQERQQLSEVLTMISKTKTGAQYIGNFPKDWKLGIVSRDKTGAILDYEAKTLGFTVDVLSLSDKKRQIEGVAREILFVVLAFNDPNYKSVKCGFSAPWVQLTQVNEGYARRLAKDIFNESPYGDPTKVGEITFKEWRLAKRAPLPTEEEMLAYAGVPAEEAASATISKKAKRFPLHKLFFFGGLGLLVLFTLRDKSKKAIQ